MKTLEKIRTEFISRYPKNYANEPELGGRSCVFSLNTVLQIIDKYAGEPCEDAKSKKEIAKIVDELYENANAEQQWILCELYRKIIHLPNVQPKQEPCEDNRLYIKVYADLEPQEKAEKLYQICEENELREVYEWLGEYCDIEPCEDAVSRQYLIDIATKDGAYDYVSAQEIANAPSVIPLVIQSHFRKYYFHHISICRIVGYRCLLLLRSDGWSICYFLC